MFIFELFDSVPKGYRSEKDDNTVAKPRQTRKTRLSLKRISKLRQVNDVRKIEHEKYLEKLSKQYKPPTQSGSLGI